jgi:hypothetical protein
MKRVLSVLAVIVLGALLSSCGKSASKEFTQTSDGVTAVLDISPFPPQVMEPATLLLTLTGDPGQSLDNVPVLFDLSMPGMKMPANQPVPTSEGNGVYSCDAVFTMSGDWQIEIKVGQSGEIAVFDFDISIK